MPLVFSVIVPFFNAAPHIRAYVEGLLAQDFPSSDYEIVMVDNNSTDGSARIVVEYGRIRLLAIWERLARSLARSAREIASGYRQVGVPLWQLPAIAVIATASLGLFFCGEVATILRDEWMTRNFRI